MITSASSSSPATVQQSIPAPAPAPAPAAPVFPAPAVGHSHYPQPPANAFMPPNFGFAPPPSQAFSFPAIFDSIDGNDIPTIGKSFPGTSSVSTVPTLACSHPAIGTPAIDPSTVTQNTDITKVIDQTNTGGTAAFAAATDITQGTLLTFISNHQR